MGRDNDLFAYNRKTQTAREQPLAARMRPRSLDQFVGQEEIVGEGTLLRRAIGADRISSMILWGPPGSGKTTLAVIIANTTRSHFESISAVMAGVSDIRRLVKEAQDRRGMHGQRTILLVDEIHRFNKAQQDALLPHVEDGTIVLIGATTENPYFEVISALVSRSRIFQLKPLTDEQMQSILRRALADKDAGLGKIPVLVEDDALAHMVHVAGGDARNALNALELAVTTTPADRQGRVHVDLRIAQDSIQRRALLYDRDGDAHYDTISAFIKSVRGGDPDAALYWMARMIYSGEDPRFIVRRMIILASEDIGLADPHALVVATAAAQALEWVGLPEAQYAMAEAAIYLATAPKSNSCGAYFSALADVEREGITQVPDHLKDDSRDAEGLGHGKDYRYPHAFPGHWVSQQYLPDAMKGRHWYEPGEFGYEQEIRKRMAKWQEEHGA
jgi:putative ATPase